MYLFMGPATAIILSGLLAGISPFEKIVCIVVDECHRAVGKNDAVTVIEKMRQEQCKFRVIGLSATPGSNREAVQASPSPLSLCGTVAALLLLMKLL